MPLMRHHSGIRANWGGNSCRRAFMDTPGRMSVRPLQRSTGAKLFRQFAGRLANCANYGPMRRKCSAKLLPGFLPRCRRLPSGAFRRSRIICRVMRSPRNLALAATIVSGSECCG